MRGTLAHDRVNYIDARTVDFPDVALLSMTDLSSLCSSAPLQLTDFEPLSPPPENPRHSAPVFIPGTDWIDPSNAVILDALHCLIESDATQSEGVAELLEVARAGGSVPVDANIADFFDAEPIRGSRYDCVKRPNVVECRRCHRPVLITRFVSHFAACSDRPQAKNSDSNDKDPQLELVEIQLPPVPGRTTDIVTGGLQGISLGPDDRQDDFTAPNPAGSNRDKPVADVASHSSCAPYYDGIPAEKAPALAPLSQKKRPRSLATARKLRKAFIPVQADVVDSGRRQRPVERKDMLSGRISSSAAVSSASVRSSHGQYSLKVDGAEKSDSSAKAAGNENSSRLSSTATPTSHEKSQEPLISCLGASPKTLPWTKLMQVAMMPAVPRVPLKQDIADSMKSSSSTVVDRSASMVNLAEEGKPASNSSTITDKVVAREGVTNTGPGALSTVAQGNPKSAHADNHLTGGASLLRALVWLKKHATEQLDGSPLARMDHTPQVASAKPPAMFYGQALFTPLGTYQSDPRSAASIVLPKSVAPSFVAPKAEGNSAKLNSLGNVGRDNVSPVNAMPANSSASATVPAPSPSNSAAASKSKPSAASSVSNPAQAQLKKGPSATVSQQWKQKQQAQQQSLSRQQQPQQLQAQAPLQQDKKQPQPQPQQQHPQRQLQQPHQHQQQLQRQQQQVKQQQKQLQTNSPSASHQRQLQQQRQLQTENKPQISPAQLQQRPLLQRPQHQQQAKISHQNQSQNRKQQTQQHKQTQQAQRPVELHHQKAPNTSFPEGIGSSGLSMLQLQQRRQQQQQQQQQQQPQQQLEQSQALQSSGQLASSMSATGQQQRSRLQQSQMNQVKGNQSSFPAVRSSGQKSQLINRQSDSTNEQSKLLKAQQQLFAAQKAIQPSLSSHAAHGSQHQASQLSQRNQNELRQNLIQRGQFNPSVFVQNNKSAPFASKHADSPRGQVYQQSGRHGLNPFAQSQSNAGVLNSSQNMAQTGRNVGSQVSVPFGVHSPADLQPKNDSQSESQSFTQGRPDDRLQHNTLPRNQVQHDSVNAEYSNSHMQLSPQDTASHQGHRQSSALATQQSTHSDISPGQSLLEGLVQSSGQGQSRFAGHDLSQPQPQSVSNSQSPSLKLGRETKSPSNSLPRAQSPGQTFSGSQNSAQSLGSGSVQLPANANQGQPSLAAMSASNRRQRQARFSGGNSPSMGTASGSASASSGQNVGIKRRASTMNNAGPTKISRAAKSSPNSGKQALSQASMALASSRSATTAAASGIAFTAADIFAGALSPHSPLARQQNAKPSSSSSSVLPPYNATAMASSSNELGLGAVAHGNSDGGGSTSSGGHVNVNSGASGRSSSQAATGRAAFPASMAQDKESDTLGSGATCTSQGLPAQPPKPNSAASGRSSLIPPASSERRSSTVHDNMSNIAMNAMESAARGSAAGSPVNLQAIMAGQMAVQNARAGQGSGMFSGASLATSLGLLQNASPEVKLMIANLEKQARKVSGAASGGQRAAASSQDLQRLQASRNRSRRGLLGAQNGSNAASTSTGQAPNSSRDKNFSLSPMSSFPDAPQSLSQDALRHFAGLEQALTGKDSSMGYNQLVQKAIQAQLAQNAPGNVVSSQVQALLQQQMPFALAQAPALSQARPQGKPPARDQSHGQGQSGVSAQALQSHHVQGSKQMMAENMRAQAGTASRVRQSAEQGNAPMNIMNQPVNTSSQLVLSDASVASQFGKNTFSDGASQPSSSANGQLLAQLFPTMQQQEMQGDFPLLNVRMAAVPQSSAVQTQTAHTNPSFPAASSQSPLQGQSNVSGALSELEQALLKDIDISPDAGNKSDPTGFDDLNF